MEYTIDSRLMLSSGNEIPVMGLGTWMLKEDTKEVVAEALRLGYRLFDTARDYGTQSAIGEAIMESGIERGELYIVTKVEDTDEDAYDSLQRNLDELQLEYADLVLIHRPPEYSAGQHLWTGLMRAQEDELALDIGVSNYSTGQIEELFRTSLQLPVVNQIEWSPFGYSEQMRVYTQDNDIAVEAFSPLTHGKRLDDPLLLALGGQYGKSPAQVLIRWNIQHGVIPIPKASRIEHLRENIDVFDFRLTEDDMEKLDDLNEYYSALADRPQYIS